MNRTNCVIAANSGLRSDKKYEDWENDSKDLRYGRVMLMADSDQDGSHIKVYKPT